MGLLYQFWAHIKCFPQGEGSLGRSDGFLSVLQEMQNLTWVLSGPRGLGGGERAGKEQRALSCEGGRAGPPPRLRGPGPWSALSAASTCLVVVDQGIWEGTGLGCGQKSDMSFKAEHCYLDSRKCLCKCYPRERKSEGELFDASDGALGFRPAFATPPTHSQERHGSQVGVYI